MNKYEAPCSVCGRILPGTPRSLPAGKRTCHPCRRDNRVQQRAAAAARPRKAPEKTTVLCAKCGTAFLAFPKAMYCGPSCRPEPNPLDGSPCGESGCSMGSRRGKRGLCYTHYNRRYQPNRSHGPGMQEWERKNPERARANREKKNRRRRAREKAAISEPYTLKEIAERDRFICQLCRKRVAMTKSFPHPKAPTIDHRVPLVESLDDTRANVQLAHFGCNCRKGALGRPEQLVLFG